MTTEQIWHPAESIPTVMFKGRCTVASYERELTQFRSLEIRLREELARDEALLRDKSALIQQREVLSEESDHSRGFNERHKLDTGGDFTQAFVSPIEWPRREVRSSDGTLK